jgi:predicted transposase YdaD
MEGLSLALPFDATLKDLVQTYPRDWLVGLNLPAAEPVEVVTPDLSTVTAFTDIVLKVGDTLLHLDFQTGPDPELPRRILLYNGLLHHRYGVPVHSLVVLLRPKADRSDLTDRLTYEAWPGRGGMDFRFEVVRVWQHPMEAFLTGPLGTLPLAPLGQVPEGTSLDQALPGTINRLVERIEREVPRQETPDLLTAAFVLTGMRVARDRLLQLFQGVQAMHESSAYEIILDEGQAKGMQRVLLRHGRKHLGDPDQATIAAIQGITDLDRLERFCDRLSDVKDWQELLQTP